ncbi:MAG: PIN domain-containing protein [Nocardioidaceae bacterium]
MASPGRRCWHFCGSVLTRRFSLAPCRSRRPPSWSEQWLGAPSALVVEPTPRHLPLLAGLLGSARTAANLVTDAHLAALALEYGARVVSFDRDFARFEGVPLLRPGD